MRRLEAWEAQLEKVPTLWEVVQHGDGRIAAAYITRNFRIAAKEAVRSHERAQKLRGIAVAFFADAEIAERFLRAPLLLMNRSPLDGAVESEAGFNAALRAMYDF